MAWIVDYAQVLEQMTGQGFRSLYYNSGAFGFAAGVATESVGWIGPPDPTLRPEASNLARHVPPPYEEHLAAKIVEAWQKHLPGKVWVMPKSHWAYELDFGGPDWMPLLLEHVGIDAGLLQSRTNAAALEFSLDEIEPFTHLVLGLLRLMLGSDFALAFPDRPMVCTLHHHKQVWWSSNDAGLIGKLREMVEEG